MVSRYLCKLTLILTFTTILAAPLPANAMVKTGQSLPAFSVTTPSGQKVTNENYAGRVLLLVFSTDYCTACKKAIPSIGRLAGSNEKKGFYVLGLFSGFSNDNDKLKDYMKDYGVSYPMALFEQSLAAEQFGMVSVPYSLLVDKKGVVAGVYYGYSDKILKQLEDQIKKLLSE